MTMNLRVLLNDPTVPDVEIADLTLDSRRSNRVTRSSHYVRAARWA